MEWEECLKENIAVRSFKDREKAKALVKTAKERIENYAKRISLDDINARFVLEEYYESLLELIHALLSTNGYKCYNHDCSISFLKEFYAKIFSQSEIKFLNDVRMLRNDIKYKGKIISRIEAEEIIGKIKDIETKLIDLVSKSL